MGSKELPDKWTVRNGCPPIQLKEQVCSCSIVCIAIIAFGIHSNDFDGQESLVDSLTTTMEGINHRITKSLSFGKTNVEAAITDSTVFYMSTHGQDNDMGDCLVTPTSTGDDDLFYQDIADAVTSKGTGDAPPLNFAYSDSCLTFSNNLVAEAFLRGTVLQNSGPPMPAPGSDRAALGWSDYISTKNDTDFAESLFALLAAGFTLHKSLWTSYHEHPIYRSNSNGDVLDKLNPSVYGDHIMTLHGVYDGNQSVDIWWKLTYDGNDRIPQ